MDKKILPFLVLFFILMKTSIYATTYYVDYANGSDSNNGTSKTTAFRHAPGDPSATGTAGGINLGAGDVIQFRAGIEYKGQIQTSWSGSSNNYIEYRGQGWGTGRATFNMEDTRGYAFKGGADYIKITGFNLYHYSSSGSDYVIYPSSGASYWDIDSCSIAYIKDWENVSVFPDKPCVYLTNSTSHITINHTEFFASGRTVIRLRYTSYVTIKNCNFGGINRGSESGWFSVGIRGEVTCNNIHIEDNVFHDGWQYGGDQVPELNHAPAFIHIYGSDATTHPDQIYIERNYFYNDKTFSTGTGTGSVEITTQVHNIYIRNNILANACQYWGTQLMLADGCDNVYVENNTFIDRAYVTGYGVNSLKVYLNSIPVGNNVYIRNNIFWSDANSSGDCAVYFHGSGTFQGVINNNEYYRNSSNQVNTFNGSVVSWSAWQGHGLDAASQYHNITEPAFVYMPPSGATTSSGDYSLNPAAINLINKGVTLNGFNDSYNGVSRPQGAAWDIGAYEYNGQNSDITPPEVTGASINNQTTVVVSFSEDVQAAGAQNPSNYSISGGVTVSSAVLNGTQVTLTTSTHSFNQQYTVTVSNVKDLAGNLINPNANSAQYLLEGDTNPPEVMGASILTATKIIVTFSESLEQASAQTAANYSITNGITVSGAVLSTDGKKVTLTTSTHTSGQNYVVTVNNVKDLAGNVVNPNANTAGYSFFNDTTPPELVGASLSGNKTLLLTFSEELDKISAEVISNYSIDKGISIDSATLLSGGTVVSLSTSNHSPNTIYTVIVSNVTDIAGNIISSQANSAQYQKESGGGVGGVGGKRKIHVSHTSAQWFQGYVPDNSIDGDPDPTTESRWAGVLPMPDSIIFDLDAINLINETHFSFYRWNQGRIYNFSVQVSVDGINWTEVLTNVVSSSSQWTINQFDSVEARYVKLVSLSSNESEWAGLWEAEIWGPDQTTESIASDKIPANYNLEQNYPNPFNPTTTIKFNIPNDQHVRINVYNIIGELVTELINKDYSAGSYTVEFNAADLPSGIYIYRLESQSFTSVRKMILIK